MKPCLSVHAIGLPVPSIAVVPEDLDTDVTGMPGILKKPGSRPASANSSVFTGNYDDQSLCGVMSPDRVMSPDPCGGAPAGGFAKPVSRPGSEMSLFSEPEKKAKILSPTCDN